MSRPDRHDWIESWSGNDSIGGRAIDISQIAYSLERSVKQFFPVNGVPTEVATQLKTLRLLLEEGEQKISLFISLVSDLADSKDGI